MDWDLIFSILKILSGPVIGMVIGYFTNFLAVKMLFRPLYPKKIGKWKLPFTPGVIPARKDALARSMGAVVSQELFTTEDLGKLINSQEVEDLLVTRVLEGISAGAAGKNLSQVITSAVGEETYVDTREKVRVCRGRRKEPFRKRFFLLPLHPISLKVFGRWGAGKRTFFQKGVFPAKPI